MHLSEGTLRRSLDDLSTIDTPARRHLAACARCGRRLAAVEADARRAATALSLGAPAVDEAAGWRRLSTGVVGARTTGMRSVRWPRRRGARRWAAGFGAAVVVSSLLVVTGAAQSLLDVFQPRQFAAVPVTAADIRSFAGLASYGTVTGVPSLKLTAEPDAAALAAAAGLPAPVPGLLPAGVPGSARYAAVSGGSASFTFSAAIARAYASAHGITLPDMPADIDGSTLTVTLQPVAVVSYGVDLRAALDGSAPPPGKQALLVVASRIPTVTSTGVTASELEDYLLAQPGIPADVAAEIRAIKDPTTTFPVPVPVSLASAEQVSVNGASGLLIGDSTGLGGVVLWQRGGVVYAVLGSLSAADVLSVAQSLH